MKRERLRRILAFATLEILSSHHSLSSPNVKRYVISHLSNYTIRKETKISERDIEVALRMIVNASRNNSAGFRFAPSGSLWTQKRYDYFLGAPLTDLM